MGSAEAVPAKNGEWEEGRRALGTGIVICTPGGQKLARARAKAGQARGSFTLGSACFNGSAHAVQCHRPARNARVVAT